MPRQQPPSDDLFARAAELRAPGATWDTVANGPTGAGTGIGRGATGTWADLLACDDIADIRAPHCHVDRCRVAASVETNLMNRLEPDGRFRGLVTPWHADDRNARRKKNPAFALFRRPIGPDFEPVWAEKWPRDRLKERKNEIGSTSFARGDRLVPLADDDTPIRATGDWVMWLDADDRLDAATRDKLRDGPERLKTTKMPQSKGSRRNASRAVLASRFGRVPARKLAFRKHMLVKEV